MRIRPDSSRNSGIERHFDKLSASHFDKLNKTHPRTTVF